MPVVRRHTHELYLVPLTDVVSMPRHLSGKQESVSLTGPLSLQSKPRAELCEAFDPAVPGSCKAAEGTCRYVHANTQRAKIHTIHVNYAYREAKSCSFPRFDGEQEVRVHAPPAQKYATEDSGGIFKLNHLLVTKCDAVLDTTGRRMARRCAHFYYGRECFLGPECTFAHVIHIDPAAKEGARAPAPAEMVRMQRSSTAPKHP